MTLQSIIYIILLIFSLAILITAYLLSFKLTRRSYLQETSNPAEVDLKFKEVTFQATDGLDLIGWYIPAKSPDKFVIQLHGHGGSMDPDLHYAKDFHDADLNVLMFDFRAHGRSEGKHCTLGYLERQDVLGAIKYVKSQGAKHIALVGFSMGAMVAILTAPISRDINVVIADGAPAHLCTAMKAWGVEHHIPAWLGSPMAGLVQACASLRMGANLFKYQPIYWIGKIAPVPLMLIHGEMDQYCPDFNKMAAKAPEAEVWREAGIGHVQISQQMPVEYRRRVVTFLKTNL